MKGLHARLALLALVVLCASPPLGADDTIEPLASLAKEYCFGCHGTRKPEAEVSLVRLVAARPLVRNTRTWERVIEALESRRMPPENEDQPTDDERRAMLEMIDRAIHHFDYSKVDDPGFERARRLSHVEYDNTMRDLFGVDLRPASRFPAELVGASGFDNSANTLFLQSPLMERYIAAAERVVELALPAKPENDVQRRTRELIFVAVPVGELGENEAARRILERFLERAYRRPPTDAEVARGLGQFRRGLDGGLDLETAIKTALQAILISPNFLFRIEAGGEGDGVWRINDWELASRLSYFLWATMPDEELFALARRGTLHEPEVLSSQVRRMLAHPRADTLGSVFAAQWLGFRHIGTRIRLDPIDNPWCTDTLMSAMRAETAMFFMSLLRDDQPIERLINADYTFVNAELAKTLYRLKDVEGDAMRRVSLDDPNRGGLFGHGSVLTLTSDHKRTSPIKRGNWILDTVLGTPPPPPPANAGELDDDLHEDRKLSHREKLARHSRDSACRGCHEKIDPLGFSLENFDYFGRWRKSYHRRRGSKTTPIDVSGQLPDGTVFEGPAGLKRVIVEKRHDSLVRQVVSKMLAYALGRELEYHDEPAIRKIVARLRVNGFRFQVLLDAVVSSYPFQFKRNPENASKKERGR